MAMSRSRGASPVTSRPPMRISPDVASSRPPTIRSTVVLPEPDGPTRTRNSPSATSRSSAETATAPPGNSLVTPAKTIPATCGSVTTRYPATVYAFEASPLPSDSGPVRAVARPLLPVGGGAADRADHRHADQGADGDVVDHDDRPAVVQVQALT